MIAKPSAVQLRMKSGKTMVALVWLQGCRECCLKHGPKCDKRRQQAPAQVLPDLQRNGP
jgi:hypothetical protein